jgi:hypothetical protein
MTVEQQPLRKVGYDKHLSLIEEDVLIRSDLFAYVLPRRLVKLGLATPLSPGLARGPVALRPHLSMSMPMYPAVICMCNIAGAIS